MTVNPFKPVKIYDGESKSDRYLTMHRMVYLDNHVCLCLAAWDGVTPFPIATSSDEYILFSLDNGRVLTLNFESFIAENYKS